MKVMAIGTLARGAREKAEPLMDREVPQTLQLYLDGKMEQFWIREDNEGVIFLMSVESVEEADKLLTSLPLGRAGLLKFDLMPIGPLRPLARLLQT